MKKFNDFINDFAELTTMGFNFNKKIDKNSDEYIDYFG